MKAHIELTGKYGGRILFPFYEIMVEEDPKCKTAFIYLHGGGFPVKESFEEVKKKIEEA